MEPDTVELIDCLRTIWKRKLFIATGTLLSALLAFTLGYAKSQKFCASTVLEVAVQYVDGMQRYLVKPETSISRIKDVYWVEVLAEMGLKRRNGPTLKVFFKRGTNILVVKAAHKDPDVAIEALTRVNEHFLAYQGALADAVKTKKKNESELMTLLMDLATRDKVHLERKLAALGEKRTRLGLRIEALETVTARREMFKEELEIDISDEEDELSLMIKEKEGDIEALKLRFEGAGGAFVIECSVLREPRESWNFIKNNRGVYAAIGAVFGLFLSVIGVFFMQYMAGVSERRDEG